MVFFIGRNIDIVKLAELAAQGFYISQIAKIMGHSKNGIFYALKRNNINYAVFEKNRFLVLDGLTVTVKLACKAKGINPDSLRNFKRKMGYGYQQAFDEYVLKKEKNISCTVYYNGKNYKLKELCKLVGFHYPTVNKILKKDNYSQSSFNHYFNKMRGFSSL